MAWAPQGQCTSETQRTSRLLSRRSGMDYVVKLLISEKAQSGRRLENRMLVEYEGKPFEIDQMSTSHHDVS